MTNFNYIQTSGGNNPGNTYIRPPVTCDLCHKPDLTTFIDGNTKLGGWANMCQACHKKYGFGLGIGKGQKYITKD